MRRRLKIPFVAVWLAVTAIVSHVVMAQDNGTTITLINGAQVSGKVKSVSTSGLEIVVGRTTRAYPWHALSPGTRYRYDQSYRMNIDGYLAGHETALLTNAPDPEYDPLSPALPDETSGTEAVSASTTLNFGLLGLPSPVVPADLPALSVVPTENLLFYAIQYGPGGEDVVVFGFAPSPSEDLVLLNIKEGRFISEKSSKRKVADAELLSYPRKSFAAELGTISVEQNVQWLVEDREGGRKYILAEVMLTRGAQKTSFVLQGDPSGYKSGKEQVSPRPLLVEPTMSFTIEIREEKTILAGRVRMGRLNVLPRSGMDLKVELDIADSGGRSLLKRSLAHTADGHLDDYPLRLELDSLLTGQQYKLTATTSLGPLLGKISHEMIFIMPDATKL